jgi:CubicO group peptidase (beta-lactamase class C family)
MRMPGIMRMVWWVMLALGLCVPPVSADRVDDYVRAQLAARHLPGVSVAVVKNGRLVKAEGYGVASLELDAPATARTVYEIGSISKQFAADAILLLVEDGKLRLDDLVSQYIAHTPAAWSAMTVRHVLTHTAGLPDFDTGNIGFSYRRDYTADEFLELLRQQPLQFTPGERWQYTNGFPILGLIVERVSGVSYMEFVETRIFKKLGLTSARFKKNGEVVPQRADGYLFADQTYRHGEPLRPAIIAPNGGILINVLDFAAWDMAMTEGRLLRAESLQAMTTPVRLTDGRVVSHGLGWFMDCFNGHAFGAHWGTTVGGNSAVIRRYVNDGLTVIVLANMDEGGGFAVDAMSKAIADLYVPGVAFPSLKPIATPDAAAIARWTSVLTSVARGVDHSDAPGLATRLPALVRARLASALGLPASPASIDYLGDEKVTDRHFNLDPAVVTYRRYRASTPAATRYLTLRLSATDRLLGVVVED